MAETKKVEVPEVKAPVKRTRKATAKTTETKKETTAKVTKRAKKEVTYDEKTRTTITKLPSGLVVKSR